MTPVWVPIATAFIALLALFVAGVSARAAVRSARAQERGNALQAQALGLPASSAATRTTSAGATKPAQAPSAADPLELRRRGSGDLYRLVNVSSAPLTGVTVDAEAVPKGKYLPKDATIAPGGGVDMELISSPQVARPSQIWVTWDGNKVPLAVQVPYV